MPGISRCYVGFSYYSRIPNKEVWAQAGKPVLPSQLVLSQQFRLLLHAIQASNMEPQHHVVFAPAYKDRVGMHRNHKRGPPPPHWLSLVTQLALEYYIPEVSSNPDQRQDLLGLKQYLDHSSDFPDRLVAAPTRHPFKVFHLLNKHWKRMAVRKKALNPKPPRP